MSTKGNLSRRKDVQTAIAHAVSLNVKDAYIKVTVVRSTTSEATEQGVLRMLQLVLLVATQTG